MLFSSLPRMGCAIIGITMERIEVNPKVLSGKPVIRGTRIPVSLVLNLLAHGYEVADVLRAYPELTEADVRAAIALGAKLTDYEEVELAKADYATWGGRAASARPEAGAGQ